MRSVRRGARARARGYAAAAEISKEKVYSDAILADFASAPHPTHAVLTVYRPYPYESGATNLLDLKYEDMEAEIRREVVTLYDAARAALGPQGRGWASKKSHICSVASRSCVV